MQLNKLPDSDKSWKSYQKNKGLYTHSVIMSISL